VSRIDAVERRTRLAARHLLGSGARASDAVGITDALVALHSSDPATVFLSVRARSEDLRPADVEDELYERRSLVRMLGMRRTLFVVRRELVGVVDAACTRAIAARERRRLEQMVVDSGISSRPASWLGRAAAAALRELESRGEAFTADLTRAVPPLARRLTVGPGTRWETAQSVGSRLMPQLAMEGRVARGRPRTTWVNGQYRWVPIDAWLGPDRPAPSAGAARTELVRRYLASFGPVTEKDVRWWTGWTARDVRAALASLPHEEVDLGGPTGLVLAHDRERLPRGEPRAVLLPALDPTVMGWKERDWYLGAHEPVLFDGVGNAGPTVWWDGRVVGGWAQRRDGEIAVGLLEDVGGDAAEAIAAEAERLAGWLGEARFSPVFLPPYQRALAA
jgi:hypothetical protein